MQQFHLCSHCVSFVEAIEAELEARRLTDETIHGAVRMWCKPATRQAEVDKYGENPRVKFQFGIGGDDKMNSSSWILHGYFERQRKLLGI